MRKLWGIVHNGKTDSNDNITEGNQNRPANNTDCSICSGGQGGPFIELSSGQGGPNSPMHAICLIRYMIENNNINSPFNRQPISRDEQRIIDDFINANQNYPYYYQEDTDGEVKDNDDDIKVKNFNPREQYMDLETRGAELNVPVRNMFNLKVKDKILKELNIQSLEEEVSSTIDIFNSISYNYEQAENTAIERLNNLVCLRELIQEFSRREDLLQSSSVRDLERDSNELTRVQSNLNILKDTFQKAIIAQENDMESFVNDFEISLNTRTDQLRSSLVDVLNNENHNTYNIEDHVDDFVNFDDLKQVSTAMVNLENFVYYNRSFDRNMPNINIRYNSYYRDNRSWFINRIRHLESHISFIYRVFYRFVNTYERLQEEGRLRNLVTTNRSYIELNDVIEKLANIEFKSNNRDNVEIQTVNLEEYRQNMEIRARNLDEDREFLSRMDTINYRNLQLNDLEDLTYHVIYQFNEIQNDFNISVNRAFLEDRFNYRIRNLISLRELIQEFSRRENSIPSFLEVSNSPDIPLDRLRSSLTILNNTFQRATIAEENDIKLSTDNLIDNLNHRIGQIRSELSNNIGGLEVSQNSLSIINNIIDNYSFLDIGYNLNVIMRYDGYREYKLGNHRFWFTNRLRMIERHIMYINNTINTVRRNYTRLLYDQDLSDIDFERISNNIGNDILNLINFEYETPADREAVGGQEVNDEDRGAVGGQEIADEDRGAVGGQEVNDEDRGAVGGQEIADEDSEAHSDSEDSFSRNRSFSDIPVEDVENVMAGAPSTSREAVGGQEVNDEDRGAVGGQEIANENREAVGGQEIADEDSEAHSDSEDSFSRNRSFSDIPVEDVENVMAGAPSTSREAVGGQEINDEDRGAVGGQEIANENREAVGGQEIADEDRGAVGGQEIANENREAVGGQEITNQSRIITAINYNLDNIYREMETSIIIEAISSVLKDISKEDDIDIDRILQQAETRIIEQSQINTENYINREQREEDESDRIAREQREEDESDRIAREQREEEYQGKH